MKTHLQVIRRSLAIVLGSAVVCLLGGCEQTVNQALPATTKSLSTPLTSVQVERIERFCADCHYLPNPATFPKSRWDKEVEQGFKFYIESGRTDLDEPTHFETVRYFTDRAPDQVAIPVVPSKPSAHRFERVVPLPSIESRLACISHLQWNADDHSLLLSDMRTGHVSLLQSNSDWKLRDLGRVTNSCRVTQCKFNDDELIDLLVCDLGSFAVGDHDLGKLQVWLAQSDDSYQVLTLADHLARVVEAQLIDYDDDGDRDVILAEFGWRNTGSLKLLRNPGSSTALTTPWPIEVIDPRHGALGVQVADFDHDGRDDYLVSFAQEFETVELWRNAAPGRFDKQVLVRLADPSYNSSSTALADINGDGRLDIVHTNGDSMDAFLPKPYHGVRWLKNRSDGTWEAHELGLLVGALAACTADFDGDGDIDIAAVGMLPVKDEATAGQYDSVVWWEQTGPGQFERHALEQYGPSHAACTAGDVNQDGLPDLIVGMWNEAVGPPLAVYLSRASK